MIRITSTHDGFRRCGVAHSKSPTEHPDGRFTKEQLEILKAEPMLVVEVIAEQATPKGTRLNATETIVLVQAASTIEALDALAEGEDRKGVLDAIAKRRSELLVQLARD